MGGQSYIDPNDIGVNMRNWIDTVEVKGYWRSLVSLIYSAHNKDYCSERGIGFIVLTSHLKHTPFFGCGQWLHGQQAYNFVINSELLTQQADVDRRDFEKQC